MKKRYITFVKRYLQITNAYTIKGVKILGLALILQSCTNDFLDQTNPNYLTTDEFWSNSSNLDVGLFSVYSALKDNNILGTIFEPTRIDIAVPSGFRNNGVGTNLYFQNFDLTTKEVNNKWAACYLGIFRANQVIEHYPKLAEDFKTEKAIQNGLYILAQARAIRGYLYYVLSTSYNKGEVPLLATVPKDYDEFQNALSSSDKVKAFYRADLQFGLDNLPKTYADWEKEGSDDLGRVTAGFCEAMLGKSYMAENDFANAEIFLKNVIDNYGYTLVDNLDKNFTGIDEFNSESIFELNFTTDLNLISDNEEYLSQSVTNTMYQGYIQPSSWLTLMYRNEKPDPVDPLNINHGANVYDNKGTIVGTEDRLRKYSLRAGNSIAMVDDPDSALYGVTPAEYGNLSSIGPLSKNKPNIFKKFTHWNTIGGGAGEDRSANMNGKSGINLQVVRLGEIYLLYAECMLEDGNLSAALTYVNRIRKRSHLILLGKSSDPGAEYVNAQTTYMDDIDFDTSNGVEEVTSTNLMNHLRFVEKPLELALEADRQVDLRRWGVFKSQLEHLASISYNTWTYDKFLNGNYATDRYKCFTTIVGEGVPYATRFSTPSYQVGIQDMVRGATNFDANTHSYFPIPLSEVNTNLNWGKVE